MFNVVELHIEKNKCQRYNEVVVNAVKLLIEKKQML